MSKIAEANEKLAKVLQEHNKLTNAYTRSKSHLSKSEEELSNSKLALRRALQEHRKDVIDRSTDDKNYDLEYLNQQIASNEHKMTVDKWRCDKAESVLIDHGKEVEKARAELDFVLNTHRYQEIAPMKYDYSEFI